MAPGRVRSDQHDEIGRLQILIALRHDIGSEGAPVACHGRRHAQPRIGVHMRGADEALGQLVGGVIIFGEKLAGEIEGNRAGAVPRDDSAKIARGGVERRVP
jgi:hypothetical protein